MTKEIDLTPSEVEAARSLELHDLVGRVLPEAEADARALAEELAAKEDELARLRRRVAELGGTRQSAVGFM